jgi:nicotinamide-nucleotide adenylyltransferase
MYPNRAVDLPGSLNYFRLMSGLTAQDDDEARRSPGGATEAVAATLPDRVGTLAMVARWKPVHLGHAAVLESLVTRADRVRIGIGSANRYDVANPFSAAESADMIRAVLDGWNNFDVVDVPDLGHGPRWRAMVLEMFGRLDLFVTANAYVRDLLSPDYTIVHPSRLVAPDRRVAVDGTMVRRAMARGEAWRTLVPRSVQRILDERDLVERFRRDFGLETLALDAREPN